MRTPQSNQTIKYICVYSGSSDRIAASYLDAAADLGREIARKGYGIVFGAGKTGMMGAMADAALGAGGEVIGIIPTIFDSPTLMHQDLTALEIVENMHVRKARMAELADAFIAMPGGLGTFDELFEILTWAQIGLHKKPVGLLNVFGYFDPLLHLIDEAEVKGFMYAEHRELFCTAEDSLALLHALETYAPPDGLEKWVEREDE